MKKIERLQKHLEVKKLEQGGNVLFQQPTLYPQDPNYATKYGITQPTLTKPLNQFVPGIPLEEQVAQTTETYSADNLHNSIDEIRRKAGTNSEFSDSAIKNTDQLSIKPTEKSVGIMGGNNQPNVPWGMIGDTAIAATNAVENALMGDKNFSASSNALDSVVDTAASAASKFGPWGLLASGALKAFNFITKIGGKTVQGFDVNGVDNSGYSQDMFHQQSESGRIWDNMSGKLKRRNARAKMALAALDVSNDEKYEQESRTNSVTDVLQQNQIALAGGIDPSLLAS